MSRYLILTMDDCAWCDKAKAAIEKAGHEWTALNMSENPEVFRVMQAIGAKTVPQVLKIIGGFEATVGDIG